MITERNRGMRYGNNVERVRSWIVDYSAARAKAMEWLGDRYLLARPINRRLHGHQALVDRSDTREAVRP